MVPNVSDSCSERTGAYCTVGLYVNLLQANIVYYKCFITIFFLLVEKLLEIRSGAILSNYIVLCSVYMRNNKTYKRRTFSVIVIVK